MDVVRADKNVRRRSRRPVDVLLTFTGADVRRGVDIVAEADRLRKLNWLDDTYRSGWPKWGRRWAYSRRRSGDPHRSR